MKQIRIFLASSEELENDRNSFGNLIRRLNKVYEKRGITLELFEWEDYDAAYNDMRKQEEYNAYVRLSDIFIAVFYRKANRFTIEEFNVAVDEFRKKSLPKTYVYCKDLEEGDTESAELVEFKQRLIDELGHYWCRYANRDTMQLNFIMQLQLIESSLKDSLIVDNGNIIFDDMPIAKMEKLPFAINNDDFKNFQNRIQQLSELIEKSRLRVKNYPDDNTFKEELQQYVSEEQELKESFDTYQKNIFDTALRIIKLQGERISERLRKAIDIFNNGKIHEANIILDQAEQDGVAVLEDYLRSKEITEQKRQIVFQSIEEILLKAKIVLVDFVIPVEERINKVIELYTLADSMAEKSSYDNKKYIDLLNDYAKFLNDHAKYDEALNCISKVLNIRESLLGLSHPDIAESYMDISFVYKSKDEYSQALEYAYKALVIREKVLGKEHISSAITQRDISLILALQGNYEEAIDFSLNSLRVIEKISDAKSDVLAEGYYHLGLIYCSNNNLTKALEYNQKALIIKESVYGREHIKTAEIYNQMGVIYAAWPDYAKSLEFYLKALRIKENFLGIEHIQVVWSYHNAGAIYAEQQQYDHAVEFMFKALSILETLYGTEHPETARELDSIGQCYFIQANYTKALECYLKSLKIKESVLGADNIATADSYFDIGITYAKQGNYSEALECYNKALVIYETRLVRGHSITNALLREIAYLYEAQGNDKDALTYYTKSLHTLKDTANMYENVDDTGLIDELNEKIQIIKARLGKSKWYNRIFKLNS